MDKIFVVNKYNMIEHKSCIRSVVSWRFGRRFFASVLCKILKNFMYSILVMRLRKLRHNMGRTNYVYEQKINDVIMYPKRALPNIENNVTFSLLNSMAI